MKNILLASLICLASFVLSAKTVSFYAPKNGGTNGYVLVAAGDRQKPYWANVVGDVMYQHSICAHDVDGDYVTFEFINSVATPYNNADPAVAGAAVSQALYNLGHTNQATAVAASGYTGKDLSSKGGYSGVYGTNDGNSFYFLKATRGSYFQDDWDDYVRDTVTPVSHSSLAVNSGVSSSGLSFNDIYPVGSIYFNVGETLPPIFTAEGRTWVKITNGTFLMSADGTTTVAGATGGANSKTLVEGNIPAHTHSVSGTTSTNGSHNHGGNTLTPSVAKFAGFQPNSYSGNVFSYSHWWWATSQSSAGVDYGEYTMNTSGKWSGVTSSNGDHTHTYSTTSGSTGSGTAFDNRPSFLAVSMWKRTN